ncbi:MAG: class A beta-lactamase [Chloroflexi bacterium]|nr:class A beta-lactamase [Chloroflexota bacterium]
MSTTVTQRAEQEIARIVLLHKATVGACAIHVASGRQVGLNVAEWFPMASTYKVPIVAQLLCQVDQGYLALDQMVEIAERDVSPGSGFINEHLCIPGLTLSVRNLLELTLKFSDNTASDVVLRLAGGATAVNGLMHTCGHDQIRVNRSTKALLACFCGVEGIPLDDAWTLEKFTTAHKQSTDAQKEAAQRAFLTDARDSCTPAAMASLLVTLHRGELLSRSSTELLFSIMRNCQTGQPRLKGMLPEDVDVAHKTGTLGEIIFNDVGLVNLPGELGHVAIAVFVKAAKETVPECERIIAEIARVAYDSFLFLET